MKKAPLLLYIHGFNSSPLSHKANVIREYCEYNCPDIFVLTPQIPSLPEDAKTALMSLVEKYKDSHNIGLIGSSLGGYMSIWLNSLYGLKAVLVNPAIKPYEGLKNNLGEKFNPYTQESYVLEEKHIQELIDLNVADIVQPEDFWLLQQTGDEVLDYRQAVEKLEGAKQTVEAGGNHSFVGFERYSADIINFLQLD